MSRPLERYNPLGPLSWIAAIGFWAFIILCPLWLVGLWLATALVAVLHLGNGK